MANGRMITNLICRDKRVNQLSTDTGRLAFTWLITFADREGRVPGDPAVVRSMVFPRRQDVTVDQMEEIIREWSDNGLVVWYEAQDDKWIWFPSFEKNQLGLRKDREAPSKIPPPPAQVPEGANNDTPSLRSNSGVGPEQVPVKLIEVNGMEIKGIEGKGIPDDDATFDLFQRMLESKGIMLGQDDIVNLTKMIAEGLTTDDLLKGIEWKIANNNGKAVLHFNKVSGPALTAKAKRLQSGNGQTAGALVVGSGGRVSL